MESDRFSSKGCLEVSPRSPHKDSATAIELGVTLATPSRVSGYRLIVGSWQ